MERHQSFVGAAAQTQVPADDLAGATVVRQRRFQVSRRKDWGKVEARYPNHVWQSDMTKIWAGPSVGWAYLVSVIATIRVPASRATLACR